MTGKKPARPKIQEIMPTAEEVQRELSKAKSMDDFFGKEGIFARLFANTIEQMLETELSEHLGYEPYEAKGRNSGNSRNGQLCEESAHARTGRQRSRCRGIGMVNLNRRW